VKAPESVKPVAAKAPAAPPPAHLLDAPLLKTPSSQPAAPAASGGLSNAVKFGGAAAAVLLAVVGFIVFGGSPESPAADPDAATTVATNDPAVDLETPPVDDAPVAPVDRPEPAAAETPAGTPAAPTTAAPAQPTQQPARGPAAPSPQDQQLQRLLDEAQTRRAGGNLPSALEAVETALKIRPREPRFVSLAGDIRQDAERRANTARGSAQAVGRTALSHVTYREGDALADQARQHAEANRDIDATRTFMAAEVRYNTAAVEGRRIADQQAAADAAAAARPVTPVAPTQPTRGQEEAAIRAVVERYRRAYNDLDARAVQAVFPSAPIAAIRKGFSGLERQAVTINNLSVTIDASGATATATAGPVVVVAKPRGASEQTTRNPMVLRLAKQGATWVITGRK
jgi:hypothetical protein